MGIQKLGIVHTTLFCLCCLLLLLPGCESPQKPKIGISIGSGNAVRWETEMRYMIDRATELGMETDARFRKNQPWQTQVQDCMELIDSGIEVLIIMPADATKMAEVLAYAKKKQVKTLVYARFVEDPSVDIFVGYDIYNLGQMQGKHVEGMIPSGNVAILKGNKDDYNCQLMSDGVMQRLRPQVDSGRFTVILNEYTGWSLEKARELLTRAIRENNGTIHAILTQNDVLAGVAAEVVAELHIPHRVVIVGMDAEVPALRRLVKGTQDATIYMDLKPLARAAIDNAHSMIVNKKPDINWQLKTGSGNAVNAYLITGKLVVPESIDRVLIEPGHVTREQVYGE